MAITLRLVAGDEPHAGVEIGMVEVGGELIVRAFRGVGSRWYQAALAHRHGRITVDGVEREVAFHAHRGDADVIDAAYRAKYGADSHFVTSPEARAAALRITAR